VKGFSKEDWDGYPQSKLFLAEFLKTSPFMDEMTFINNFKVRA
jgi:hypothetical protein